MGGLHCWDCVDNAPKEEAWGERRDATFGRAASMRDTIVARRGGGFTTRHLARHAAYVTPPLVAASLVLTEFASGNAGIWPVLLRPVALAMAGAAVLEALVLLVIRRREAAIALTCLLVLIGLGGDALMIVALATLIGWLAFAGLQRLLRRPVIAHYHPVLPVIAGFTGLITLFQVATSGALVIPRQSSSTAGGGTSDPNIYVFVLDGYARQDTLHDVGFDNGPFLDELETFGFDIYRDSRSNYSYTATAIATMLNMRPLDQLPDMPRTGASWQQQSGALLRSINESAAVALLHEHGYRVVSIPPVATHSVLAAVDDVRDSGSLTDFERHILTDTSLAGILERVAPDWIAQQYRDRAAYAFDQFDPQPPGTFLWAHVLAPHPPFIFGADGSDKPLPDCIPGCPWGSSWADLEPADVLADYVPQLQHINRMVAEAVRQIVSADPRAVIVLMGDHGARYDQQNPDEWFRNFLAVRSPEFGHVLGTAPTSVNILQSTAEVPEPHWVRESHWWRPAGSADSVHVAVGIQGDLHPNGDRSRRIGLRGLLLRCRGSRLARDGFPVSSGQVPIDKREGMAQGTPAAEHGWDHSAISLSFATPYSPRCKSSRKGGSSTQ